MAEKKLRSLAVDAILKEANRRAFTTMKTNERALLQERVRTLVLRHAIEATLSRLAIASGDSADDELLKLEHAIVSAARQMASVPDALKLSTMVAIEDAIGTIRGAFDVTHQRIEAVSALAAPRETLAA